MSEIIKLRSTPEPVEYKGRERLVSGWSTAAVSQWLLTKKAGEQYASLSEIAVFGYARDSQSNRDKVRSRVTDIRRWLADRNEFLLVRYTQGRRISALKVCDPSNENDRQIATEQLLKLEAKEEITHAERVRWEELLFLPPSILPPSNLA